MIEGYSPVAQALLGTFFTWGVTALGSALVFFLDSKNEARNRKMFDAMLVSADACTATRVSFVAISRDSFRAGLRCGGDARGFVLVVASSWYLGHTSIPAVLSLNFLFVVDAPSAASVTQKQSIHWLRFGSDVSRKPVHTLDIGVLK